MVVAMRPAAANCEARGIAAAATNCSRLVPVMTEVIRVSTALAANCSRLAASQPRPEITGYGLAEAPRSRIAAAIARPASWR